MTAWRLHTPTLFYSLLASLADVNLFLVVGSLDGREAFAVEARCPGVKCVAFAPNPRNLEGLSGIAQTVQLMHIEAETKRWFEGEKLAPDFIEIMKRYGLELAGSNLDTDFHKPQGDLVFLRKQAVSGWALRRAVLTAWLVQRFAVQKIARKVLPAKLYRTGREWFVQNVATR
jgi:hypothetical protein